MNTNYKNYHLQTHFDKGFKHLLITFLVFCALLVPNITFCSTGSNFPVTVIDGKTKEPLIAASIYTDDLKFSALTDLDGKAMLVDIGHRDEVNFTYVGYTPIKVAMHKIRAMGGIIPLYSDNLIEEIVVIGRTDATEDELPYVVDRITQANIASRNSQTTADVLGDHADVYIQKSQMGGGSPIIRGFEANKVLLVLDGIRLNNAIYRNGHLQNAITVDGSMLEQVEVIYGPGSLMYGSEALGGVVHFRSREPKISFSYDEKITETNAYTRFSSANLEKTFHFDFQHGGREWASLTSMSYSSFGDLRVGANRPDEYPDFGRKDFFVIPGTSDQIIISGDPNRHAGTGYKQVDFLQKIRFQPKESFYFIANFQYSSSSDVPRYDALLDTLGSEEELKWAEWNYGPQKRLMASLKMKAFAPKLLYDKATFIAAFQLVEEDRLKRKFKRYHRTFNLEDVYVYSFTADFDKTFGKNSHSTLSYGFDGNYNQVFSEAGQINIRTARVHRGELTRYPSDNSTLLSYAAYLNYRWKGLDSMLVFNAGARYSATSLFAKYKESDLDLITWPRSYVDEGINVSNNALTYGAGLTFNTPDRWQIHLLASTAFRSPNIDDFAKIRVKGSKAIVPNINLRPETSLSGEATLAKTIGKPDDTSLKLSATGFYTILEDVIVRLPGYLPNGDSTIVADGDVNDIQQNFNASEGFIYGASANILLRIGERWKFKSSLSYTKGRVGYQNEAEAIDTLVPIAHIPPIYGQTSLQYKTKKLRFELVAKYNAKKPISEYAVNKITIDENTGEQVVDFDGTSDNPEMGIAYYNEDGEIVYEGVYGWATLNLYSSFQFNKRISLDLALENILDQHYRLFASGVSAPGRNFIVTLRGKF